MSWLLRLRTWLLLRLGLWRGRWRRHRVTVAPQRFFPAGPALSRWHYGLYAPGGLRDTDSAPLIVLLHGCGQRALNFAHATGWTAFADRERVRLLCPDQRRLANLYRCWNWFHPLDQAGIGELGVVNAMVDDVAQRLPVGATAVVGLSAGGALAALLAFHHPSRYRAAVCVAAPPLLGAFNVQRPQDVMRRGLTLDPALALGARHFACAPIAIVHGLADDVVAPRCADQLEEQAVTANRRAGATLVRSERAGDADGVRIADHRDGQALRVRAIRIDGLRHEWSGGPGGHPHCTRGGTPLTALAGAFLRDVGFFADAPRRA